MWPQGAKAFLLYWGYSGSGNHSHRVTNTREPKKNSHQVYTETVYYLCSRKSLTAVPLLSRGLPQAHQLTEKSTAQIPLSGQQQQPCPSFLLQSKLMWTSVESDVTAIEDN